MNSSFANAGHCKHEGSPDGSRKCPVASSYAFWLDSVEDEGER